MILNLVNFDIHCEWGQQGVDQLSPISDVVIIVDVLSFSTCVDIAVSRGASVYPYGWQDTTAQAYAQSLQARLAQKRGGGGYSLSPASLQLIDENMRLVLPSPNGSALSFRSTAPQTLTGCFRNYQAVAQAAQRLGQRIALVPAGEKWPDGSLRPALEDWLGAGAIISGLTDRLSPEAQAAAMAFQSLKQSLPQLLQGCSSGRELIERGFAQDVDLAAAMNVSDCVPTLVNHAYVNGAEST